MNLKIATEHVAWDNMVEAFTNVTGKKAVYKDVTLDEYFALGTFGDGYGKVGHSADHNDSTLQTFRSNFSGFWNMWKFSGGNNGAIRRDYALLDDIPPQRVRTVEEWMRLSRYEGKKGTTLKDISDGARNKGSKVSNTL
jgi:hypothetical protein